MFFSKSVICAVGLGALADAQLSIGSAANYAVFAASTITNTGLSVIGARIGLSPGTSITGFPPGINAGQDVNNAAALQAKADIQALYTALAALPPTQDLTGTDLGGKTIVPGVYSFSSSGGLTGNLILDAQGDPNAQFVFQFGSTITTATASSVVLINGAQACNVFWQVGSSATLGTATIFAGVVIAQASITATTGVSLLGGGLYALTAAVTLDTNAIDLLGACGIAAPPAATSTTSAIAVVTPPIIAPIISLITSILTLAPVTITLPAGTSVVTQPASTITLAGGVSTITLAASTITAPPGTSLITLPASTSVVTLAASTLTLAPLDPITSIVTLAPVTITLPPGTSVVTQPASTITLAGGVSTITLAASTITAPPGTSLVTLPASTLTLQPATATVTVTLTSSVTDPASTTTVTLSETRTIIQTVATSRSVCTSTTTKMSTKYTTKTLAATPCPKKTSKRDIDARAARVTKTVKVTKKCAGHTSTKQPSMTKKVTYISTSTVWKTKTGGVKTMTSTKQPVCTAKAKRDFGRMFE
ncbi:hypothetical protein LTR56_010797 [Elasticomyces elasticus]|nr:hypothetical protein LTR56_010797 [Elasticomyces elasticus]KAK3667822.1 hypothetical protein LTR22_001267 [Elasticomyces elasticus]KAK4932185.1 hypothetical protein LTR49_001482 [Elasticomyces elasticus]KAK5763435.1 hypothetical protein LTS12_006406 [Elasticomyces elasticus]